MSESDIAIKVEGLSKSYRLVHSQQRQKYKTLQDELLALPSRWFAKKSQSQEEFWALKDVSFEIRRGDVVGIIGRNGAGKSTLLKILSRITAPTQGVIKIFGRIGSLLEVGTGFHPELTGRENIFLNGAILGMRQHEVRRRFDEIVEFAGVEKFLDTPVKHYSSGMYMRLAFAVAAHLDPEILIVDEVLAVGDAEFQKKCMGKMGEVAKGGRTVLFVSHNMNAVQSLCSRGIVLQEGMLDTDGSTSFAVEKYLASQSKGIRNLKKGDKIEIVSVVLKDQASRISSEFQAGTCLRVEIEYFAKERLASPYLWVGVGMQGSSLFGANMLIDGVRPETIDGHGVISCVFRSLNLLPNVYTISIGGRESNSASFLFPSQVVGHISVVGDAIETYGFKGEHAGSFMLHSAPVLVPYQWHFPDGTVHTVEPFVKEL